MTASSAAAANGVSNPAATAEAFVSARLAARATPDYPGVLPTSLDEGYAVQEIAIGLYPDRIIGWKVGGIAPARQAELGSHRLAGPIFARNNGPSTVMSWVKAIEGGFTAIEAEFLIRIGPNVDPAKTEWTIEEATAAVDAVFIGLEIGRQPAIGHQRTLVRPSWPRISATTRHLLGPQLTDWQAQLPAVQVESVIDGVSVGTGGSPSLEGGALESVRFLLGHCAKRGRPLTAGCVVSSGAVTGVHRIHAGSDFTCDFKGVGVINGTVVKAEA
jgi:2-keto-4-pentenoate hydratase